MTEYVAQSGYAAQMEAGKALLADSGHVVSNIVSAEPCFRRALASNPSSVEALAYIGLSMDHQGRWTEAKAIYEQVLAIDPSSALARERYAQALEELNIVDEPKATTLKRSPFTRFPETLESVCDLESAIRESILSHTPIDRFCLTKSTRVVTFGSCFAANIANALTAEGFLADNLTIGEALNSTFANLGFFRWALGVTTSFTGDMLGRFARAEVDALLRDADLVIYTLGVAPAFFDAATGEFVLPSRGDGVRGFRSGKYLFRTTTVDENLANLKAMVAVVRDVNPDCKFVFSLSPVPLTATLEARSAMEADCLSKAVLRVAVDQLVSSTPGCLYWPAFEAVRWLGAYIPDMYGEEDGTTHHVSERVIRTIMRLFIDMYGR